MNYAFLDEFGGVGKAIANEPYLILAALATDTPRQLDLVVNRARKRLGQVGSTTEIKATHSSEQTIRWVLERIAALDIALIIVVRDKQTMASLPKDSEDLYRKAAGRTVRLCVERWQQLEIVLDRRYTQEHLRRKLEWQIRQEIADIPGQTVLIRQADSQTVKALQAVDFVAWAAGQKYVRGNESYFELIRDKVLVEEVLRGK
jgi:hypothetical protein